MPGQEKMWNPKKSRSCFEAAPLSLSLEVRNKADYNRIVKWLTYPGLEYLFYYSPSDPASDPSAARTFIRNFFDEDREPKGERLNQELMLTEPMVRQDTRFEGD